MSRDDGFAVMDVSTDLLNDPKVAKLWLHAPTLAGTAFVGFMATLAQSWKHGRRMSIDDAWPPFLPFSKPAVEALVHVGLLDKRGLVNSRAWKGWFGPAKERREVARAKWKRANDKRRAEAEANGDDTGVTPESPRGSTGVTPAPVPSAPSVPPAPTRQGEQGARPLDGGRSLGLVHPERRPA